VSDGAKERLSVFVDGQLVSRDGAAVSVFDAGFQHGVGVFETMRATVEGDTVRVMDLESHLDRLQESAALLKLSDDLKTGALGEAIEITAKEAGIADARVRLTVTGGDLNLLASAGRKGHHPTVVIQVTEATAYPEAMFEKGIGVTIAESKANPLDPTAGHKTLNYWWRLRELQAAAAKGAAEAVVLMVTNHLCGGCVSNLFCVRNGVIETPIARGEEAGPDALPSPVLPGITRMKVMGAAKELGIEVRARMMSVGDLLDADEVFLTNSSWGVLPVVRVEAEAIGSGEVGEVTKRVRGALG
jgi:branched-subunit amino acid aminotransferase/4-amino-4-deoxychorismate lyase